MNRREKAIWNISIFISIVVLCSFIYTLIINQTELDVKKKNFIATLKKFEEYGIPTSSLLIDILNDNDISIKKNTNTANKEKTVSLAKDFIEYKEVISKKKTPFTSIVGFSVKGNAKWDEGENFRDANNNEQYDNQEKFTDSNNNGQWDQGEKFEDKNNNEQYDNQEKFTDREEKIKPGCHLLTEINGKRFKKVICSNYRLEIDEISFFNDRAPLLGFENLNNYGTIIEGENFEDKGNGLYDEGEPFKDKNNNGQWDKGDPYTDLNNNKAYDALEEFEDKNNNGQWDEGERFKDLNTNGEWDKGDPYEDLDNNDVYSYDEKFTDKPDGIWAGEAFKDIGNSLYDEGEPFEDKGNGQWDQGEDFKDIGNGQYDEGELFEDKNNNGQWDYALLKDLKATNEEVVEALNSNYFFTKVTDKDKKINIYIKTDKEIDEYNLKANCFECTISKLEESMNSLEISLKGQREHEFILPKTLTDPTDLSNVVILPGYEGGYNQSVRRNALRLSLVVFKGDDNASNSVSIDFKGHTYRLKKGDPIDEGMIYKINKDNVEYKKDNEIKVLTLDKK